MPHVTAYGILAVQALFFFLGGIRDNFMTGKVIMPDEEYLQSWWYGVCVPRVSSTAEADSPFARTGRWARRRRTPTAWNAPRAAAAPSP